MGYKTILIAAAIFSAAYPPTRNYEVGTVCKLVPTNSVTDAEAMLPVPASFWAYVNNIAAGNFGAPPTAPVFLRIWLLEKDAAAALSQFLSNGNATTLGSVCAGRPTIS